MIEKLLGMADGQWFVALLVVGALTTLAKGLFGLRRSTSQDRRDFLDLWSRRSSDDLWLEVAVRHQFGSYLPASLIRQLQRSPQAGRALLDVASGWDFLDMKDGTGEIHWRARRHENPRLRKLERKALMVLYFALAFPGLMLGYYALIAKSGLLASWMMWPFVALLLGTALFCLIRHDTLDMAERSMTRWLRPPNEAAKDIGDVTVPTSVSDLLAGGIVPHEPPVPSNAP